MAVNMSRSQQILKYATGRFMTILLADKIMTKIAGILSNSFQELWTLGGHLSGFAVIVKGITVNSLI